MADENQKRAQDSGGKDPGGKDPGGRNRGFSQPSRKRKSLKKAILAVIVALIIPTVAGVSYLAYVGRKVQTRDMTDPIWDKPIAAEAFEQGSANSIGTEVPQTTIQTDETAGSKDTRPVGTADPLPSGSTVKITPEEITPDGVILENPSPVPPPGSDGVAVEPEAAETPNDIAPVQNQAIRNVLLLGVDSTDDSGRSDTMMILTVDHTARPIRLSSIMRDSYVFIQGYGMDKINHAYAFGGARLALQTVNSNFSLNISDVMVVNFSQLIQIVDAVGGIPMELTDQEASHLGFSGGGKTYGLDGRAALAYSRIRAIDDDFARTGRQRRVLTAVINKIKALPIARVPGAVGELLPMVWTSLTLGDIIATAASAVAGGYDIIGAVFPGENASWGIMIDDIWYLDFHGEEQTEALDSFIFNPSGKPLQEPD